MKGLFITFEGTEGSGKSSHSKLLYIYLKSLGYKVIYTKEPGKTQIGKNIRKILLNPKNKKLTDIAELFLYLADRHQHLQEIIKPNLAKGNVVICDRFTDATVAYQGYGRKISLKMIEKLNKLATDNIKPDLTILLDVPLLKGLRRACRIGPYKGDRMEKQKLDFHKLVKSGYKRIARMNPKRVKVISVNGEKNKVQRRVRAVVNEVIKKKNVI